MRNRDTVSPRWVVVRTNLWAAALVMALTGPAMGQAIPTAQQPKILRMLAARSKAVCAALSTWRGELKLYDKEVYNKRFAEAMLSEIPAEARPATGEFFKTMNGKVTFALDLPKNRFFSRLVGEKPRFFGMPDGRALPMDFEAFEQSSVVTPEGFLHFEPRMKYARAGGGSVRMAFRDPAADALRQQWGTVVDPRVFLGYGRLTWENLEMIADAIDSEGVLEIGGIQFHVSRTKRDGETIYNILLPIQIGEGRYLIQDMAFPEHADYNLETLEIYSPEGAPHQSHRWKYVREDETMLPTEVRCTLYDPRDKRVTFQRLLQLVRSEKGTSKSKAQPFDYTALGLQKGDILADRIADTSAVVENGSLRQLGESIDEYLGRRAPVADTAP